MGDVGSKLMAQFADNLNTMIDEQGLAAPTTSADDDRATSDDAATSEPSATETPASDSGDPTPVRKIAGPATEPIDLMEVGGSSILDRVAPAVIAIVVLLLLLRRRRS